MENKLSARSRRLILLNMLNDAMLRSGKIDCERHAIIAEEITKSHGDTTQTKGNEMNCA